MRVGINTLFFAPDHNYGAGTYLLELLEALGRVSELDYVLFTNKKNHEIIQSLTNFEVIPTPVDGSNRVMRILYEQLCLHRSAKKLGCDLLFCPGYLGPVKPTLPTVLTVHDTQFLDVPEYFGRSMRLTYNTILPRAVANSSQVIAISQFTRSRINHHFPTSSNKVSVVYEGVPKSSSADTAENEASFLRGIGIEKPYLLSVSSAIPHKNVERLKQAFQLARTDSSIDFELVIVGHTSQENETGIRYTGYVTENQKNMLYRNAHAYITASLYEGFGLTVLEAMQANIPVASSNAGSLPEVGGQACWYFNPYEVTEIKEAITCIMFNEEVRAKLMAKSKEQLEFFTWDKCAKETEAVFRSVLESGET